MRLLLIFIGFLLLGCAVNADQASCHEKDGYINRESLIKLIDLDCSDNELSGLCSILLGSPLNVEGREFKLFTFLRRENNKIKTYLNMKPKRTESDARIGFEFSESEADQITIISVYENIEGCTLRSSVNLGVYFDKAS